MDYPFEYVERVWKYPTYTRSEIDKLKTKTLEKTEKEQKNEKEEVPKKGNKTKKKKKKKVTRKRKVKSRKEKEGVGSEELESDSSHDEEEIDRKRERILKDIREVEADMLKRNWKHASSSSTNTSLATFGLDSLIETSDSDVVDRLFPNQEEAVEVEKRRFKIMRECACANFTACSSRSRTSEDSSSSTNSTTSLERTGDEDEETDEVLEMMDDDDMELSQSEGEIRELKQEIAKVELESEQDSDDGYEESAEEVSTSSEETKSESDAGYDVEEELEALEELLEERNRGRTEKEPWDKDSDESDSISEDEDYDDDEDDEDGDDEDEDEGGEDVSKEERTRNQNSKPQKKEVPKPKKKDEKKSPVKVKDVQIGGKSKKPDEQVTISDPRSTLELSSDKRSGSGSDSDSSSDSMSRTTSSSSSSETSNSENLNSLSLSSPTTTSSSSPSSSTLLWSQSVSAESLKITSSGSDDDDENSDGVLNFQWDSDDLYGSTGTDEEVERAVESLGVAMKNVDAVFAETMPSKGMSKLDIEKFRNFVIPLPPLFETTNNYEMMEEPDDPNDRDAIQKTYWLVQQINTGRMNSVKFVSRMNPTKENLQAQRDLDVERKLLYELLAELPEPSHIARLADMGFNHDFKFLIFEDLGIDLKQLFDQSHPILHKSSSLYLLTYFTFNAIKELHSYDVLHGNVCPLAFSVQIEPFNVKITDYSKTKKLSAETVLTTDLGIKPDAFSPRIYHTPGGAYDEFVDFESWVYTMIHLCTKHGLPWVTNNATMLAEKEAFFEDYLDFDYTGCTEAVPIVAGCILEDDLSYTEFMQRMNLAFSIDSMLFTDTDRPVLFHLDDAGDKVGREDPGEVLDLEHWDPADESDSSDGMKTEDEKQIYAELWKEKGLDENGYAYEEKSRKVGSEESRSQKSEQTSKSPDYKKASGRCRRPDKTVPMEMSSMPETSRNGPETSRNGQDTSPPAVSDKKKNKEDKDSSNKGEKEEKEEKKDEKKEEVVITPPKVVSDTDLTLGELMGFPISELFDDDPSTFSTSSSSGSSATSYSSWTASTDRSENGKYRKWDLKTRKSRAEPVEYSDDASDSDDYENYGFLLAEWMKAKEYSTSSGSEFGSEPELEDPALSDADEPPVDYNDEADSAKQPSGLSEKSSAEMTAVEQKSTPGGRGRSVPSDGNTKAVQDLINKMRGEVGDNED